jgi:hypothetical protein
MTSITNEMIQQAILSSMRYCQEHYSGKSRPLFKEFVLLLYYIKKLERSASPDDMIDWPVIYPSKGAHSRAK